MEISELPFKEIGITSEAGKQIVEAVHQTASEFPHKSINIQTISEKSGFSAIDVKNVLYILLGYRFLKATFLPLHRHCDNPIGQQEKSAEIIYEKAIAGELNWCTNCQEPIESPEDIQVQIIFWKPGTNA